MRSRTSSLLPRTLAGQFLLFQLVVVALVLAAVTAVSVAQSSARFTSERGVETRAVAQSVSQTPLVRRVVRGASAALLLAPTLERATSLSDLDRAYVVAVDGRIVASVDPALVGTSVDLSDSDVQEGRAWTGEVDDDGGRAVATHYPVYSNDGRLLAFTAVSVDLPSTYDLLLGSLPDGSLFLALGAVFGLGGSWLLSRLIRRGTRGLEPAQIAALADQREALLHSIREGVVAVDDDGVVTLVNDAAQALLGHPDALVGRRVVDLDLPPAVRSVLLGHRTGRDEVVVVGGRAVVLNRQAASSAGRSIGTVTTLRDRSELVALRSQLSSTRSVTDTLRAQAHEFANQLHTVSGLIQLQEYDEAQAVVGALTRRRAEISDAITARVADPPVAAILVAKTSSAIEAGLELRLDPASRLGRLDGASSSDLTTVLGNLVDNALHAVAARGSLVEVLLAERDDVVEVRVRDDGPGVPPEAVEEVFERGWSTKDAEAGERGIGLALVRMICERRGGDVRVARGPEGGAVFEARLPRQEAT